MSQYVSTENEEMVQVASNQGWSDFCEWVKSLPVESYPSLHHLCEFGSDNDADELLSEIDTALESEGADEDVMSTAEGLLEFLERHQDAEIIIVGNGVTGDPED